MTAIIFSVPLVHYNWVIHSVEEGTTLPFKPYFLPAGVIDAVPYFVYPVHSNHVFPLRFKNGSDVC